MDLSQLRTLIHVAELGSLSKAADRLHIAQPALSRQIRLLEEELGVRLFERHGRGMVITDIGRKVLGPATRILNELDEIRAGVSQATQSLSGRVVIGMPPTVAEIISGAIAGAFRQTHPQVLPRFVSAFTGHLLDWLQRGEVDVAVLYDPQPTRSLRSKPLLMENLFLIGPAEARLSVVRAVPFARLADQELLLPSPRHGLRALVEECAARAGITLKVTIEADSLSTLKDMVRQGYGSTILPLPPIHDDIVSGRLSGAPLVEPSPVRRLVLAYASDRPVTRAARFAEQAIKTVIGDLVQRGIWIGHLVDE
ncbi:MAG: LysR substrate-binding domain-containing protein [Alphaproteobacteria bacterium]